VSEVWSIGTYERLAAWFTPVHERLVEVLHLEPGERLLDLATGTGAVAILAARAGAEATGLDLAEPMLAKARAAADDAGVDVEFELGDVEHLPYDDASFDVIASAFGLVFAPDHANVADELRRVTRPGGRIGFTGWRPNQRLGELYRRFTEDPLEGREAYEWGREDHVEDMLAEGFELDFEDGTLWLEAASGEEIWDLFSTSAPPVVALVRRLDPARREEFRRAFVEHYDGYRVPEGGIRVPRRYLLSLGTRR
jgi:SAM-dependent methyltransferase